MKKIKNKKSLYTLIIVAVLVLFVGITQITAAVNTKSLKKIHQENPGYSVSTAESNISVKSQPVSISISKAKIKKGDEIKIVANGNKWNKVVVFSKKGVKTGYIRANKLGEVKAGVIPVKSLSFENSNILGDVGETVDIKPILTPVYANEQIVYEVEDESIAIVKDSKITFLKAGETKVTAKTGNCTETFKAVTTTTPETLEFNSQNIAVDLGTKVNIYNLFTTKIGDNVKFTSSNPNVAKVEKGTVIPVSEGKTIITAQAGKKVASSTFEIRTVNGNSSGPLNMPNIYGNVIDYHPSVLSFDEGFGGYKYWIAYTPYEGCNDFYENPHVMASNDLVKWELPNGYQNPLEPVPSQYEYGITYNSDTDLVYNTDTKELECWWRFYDYANLKVALCRKTTKDGVHWSEREEMYASEDMTKYDFLSPALIYEDGIYKMWSINHKNKFSIGYRESKDGRNWSKERILDIQYEDPIYNNWHLDVMHTPKGYEMDISSSRKDTRGHLDMSLYYTYSPDNINYTKVRPMLHPRIGTDKWDNRGLYRSCMLYSDGKYYLFYSGINKKTGPVGVGMVSGNNPFHMK